MACNSCAKPFSLLRKEKGCPGCGFSYCAKCLSNKIFLAKINAETKVCAKCIKVANNPSEAKASVQPPDAYYKRLGVTNVEQSVITSNKNMDSEDQQILERLKKLKEGRNVAVAQTTDEQIKNRLQNIKGEMPSTSDAEIQARLAKLRGVPVETFSNKPVLLPPDTRTEQEQADDLLKQYMEVSNIDTKYKEEFDGLINDMEQRMLKLKGSDPPGPNTKGQNKAHQIPQVNSESEDEEEIVQKIVEKIKSEASFADDNDIGPSTNDEIPFCEICNEDANVRCLGCKYLFCKRCFAEHKDDDDGCNRYEIYQAPSKH